MMLLAWLASWRPPVEGMEFMQVQENLKSSGMGSEGLKKKKKKSVCACVCV